MAPSISQTALLRLVLHKGGQVKTPSLPKMTLAFSSGNHQLTIHRR